jgi:hypothetical protein
MFPQVRRKTWAIRPVRLPPFVGQVNHWQPVSTDCSNPLVYGGGVNSRGQHHAKSRSSREIGRYRRSQTSRRGLRIGVVVTLVVVVGTVAWFGSRVLMVKSELEASQALVGTLQSQATAFDLDGLGQTSDELAAHTSRAAAGTRDVTWRAAEYIPVVGPNLEAVRLVTESIDGIIDQVAAPAIGAVSSLDLGAKDPVTGGFDLTPIDTVKKVFAVAPAVFADAQHRLDSIDTSRTISQVGSVVDQLKGVLETADSALSEAEPYVNVISGVLGQEGARNYLLAFQNNAESMPLGGSAASYTMISVDNGAIAIAAQGAGSQDLQEGVKLDIDVDQSALDLYGDYLISYANTSTSRPDFPTAARIMQAFWARDKGTSVDGVISVDPLALAQILKATGPVTLASGDVLSSENAVSLLVNEVYYRFDSYKEPEKVDAFFQEASASILNKVMSGDFDMKLMFSALQEQVDAGSIMMWSNNTDEQALLDGTRLQGTLPSTNDDATVIGAYYRDTSASKIDYYLETSTQTTSDICTVPDAPSFTTSVTLHSTLTEEQAEALPDYIAARDWGADKFRTEIFVYGPVGSSLSDFEVVSQGLETIPTTQSDDLGRPVAAFAAYLAPGESTTVSATFLGMPGVYGPLEVRGNPMIIPSVRTIEPVACN